MTNVTEKTPPASDPVKSRDSGLELFRIFLMLLVIAHHYVVHSGIMDVASDAPFSFASVCVAAIGAWGKTAINGYVLITGYFMCRSRFKARKFFALLLEAQFYGIILYFVMMGAGYHGFSWEELLRAALPFSSLAQNFTGCFLIFYLTIPFLNILISHLGKRMHLLLILLSLGVYCVIGSLSYVSFSYVGWFIVLYFVASYIRIYPCGFFTKKRWSGLALAGMVLLDIASIVICSLIVQNPQMFPYFHTSPFAMLAEVHMPFAFLTAVFAFLLFKNIHFRNKFVNTVSGATFGVFLIHDSDGSVRKLIWQDILRVPTHYGDLILLYALLSAVAVFVACALCDLVRQYLLVRPAQKLAEKLRKKKNARKAAPPSP